jgi:hypothetical protein
MKKKLALSVAGLAVLLQLTASAQQSAKNQKPEELEIVRVHWAKGVLKAARTGRSPDMTWHSGQIMTNVATQSIFWGTSWTSNPGDKISGMDLFYEGFGGSNYAATSNEYTGSNGKVTSSVTFGGHFVDSTAATGGQNVAPILAEVCKVIPNPVSNGYYPVYTDIPRGHAGYCAWHSYGSCGATPVQIAFFFKLDGDAGCDPQSNVAGQSQGLAALANVSGHELSEARSDPRNGGWYDSSGAENGDKCAWSFNVPSVTLTNGSRWKIQGEWSNQAYNTGTGYANNSGQKGCLDGH